MNSRYWRSPGLSPWTSYYLVISSSPMALHIIYVLVTSYYKPPAPVGISVVCPYSWSSFSRHMVELCLFPHLKLTVAMWLTWAKEKQWVTSKWMHFIAGMRLPFFSSSGHSDSPDSWVSLILQPRGEITWSRILHGTNICINPMRFCSCSSSLGHHTYLPRLLNSGKRSQILTQHLHSDI